MEKTYLVSGAGSGIGRATAVALSQNARVVLLGRNRQSLEETRTSLNKGHDHVIAAADIRDRASLSKEFARIGLESLNLHGVFANAGVGGENEYGANDRWDEIIGTNLTGTYNLVNEALPALRASKHAYKQVLVVSSILGRIGVPNYSAYCASKAGLLGLVRSWAATWASEKILVNAICPGWVETSMATEGLDVMAKTQGRSYEEVYEQQMGFVPLKKMAQPNEIGAFVRFLMSEEQCSITGQALDVNNGAWMG